MTVAEDERAGTARLADGQAREAGSAAQLEDSPVSKGRRVLQGPLCEVEGGVPRDQARGAVGDDG